MFSITTVPTGERIAVWNIQGELQLVDGPRRLWLWRKRAVRVERLSAREGEYLVITHRDGTVEHRAGPAMCWKDPVEHQSISVEQAIDISAQQALVVYGRVGDQVQRRIVRGPAQFVPMSGEWLHRFSWHGSDPKDPRRKIPHALLFDRLRVIPDQMYVEVESARTADDALLTVRFMVFFELLDIGVMLDQTHDPIADLINAITADAIEFTAARSFVRFKEDTQQLNTLSTFQQLVMRAERIGYRIGKVVYRGYTANAQLQEMHDRAIEARTQLRLEAETETQAQELEDLKLQRESERLAQRQAMEQDAGRHAASLERQSIEARIARERIAGEARRLEQAADQAQRQSNRQAVDHQRLAFTAGMREAGVDLTRWLVARYQHPDRLIRIEGREQLQLQVPR